MKKILNLLLFIVVLTGVAQAQIKGSEVPYLTKSLSSESIRDVFVRTSGGSISVSGVDASEARVEVYVRPSNNRRVLSKEDIREELEENYELTVSVADNKLSVVAEPKGNLNWKQALSISFKVFVPEKVSTDLKTSGGGITLMNLTGTHKFATSGGGLNLDKVSGLIHGRTSGGGISVRNSKDEIDLATSGGSIEAVDCNGSLTLKTSGGSIRLSGLEGTTIASTSGGSVKADEIKGQLSAKTSGGSMELLNLTCSVDAHTSGGSMEVSVTELGEYLKVSSSGGNIRLEMPDEKGIDLDLRAERLKVDALTNFSGSQSERKITGKINGGGIPVEVHTSGSISLALK